MNDMSAGREFTYEAFTKDGYKKSGTLLGHTMDDVAKQLKREGLIVLKIGEGVKAGRHRWKVSSVIEFSYKMSLLIESGIPLRRILDLVKGGDAKYIPYDPLYRDIQRGYSLSQSLRRLGFPTVGLALLEAGEAAGNLGITFQIIHEYYEKERKSRQKIISAITYPMFLFTLMVVFFLVTILFILPSFKKVFATMKIDVPIVTKVLFAMGDMASAYWVPLSLGTILFIATISYAYTQGPLGRTVDQWLWRKGQKHQLLSCVYYTNLLKVWALLLDSGISLLDTLTITKGLWINHYGQIQLDNMIKELQKGQSFHKALEVCHIGTPFIWSMVTIGEESGELVNMLTHCSGFYESILNRFISRLERLLEPILLSVMGIFVGVLVISIMYPMFTSISSIGK